MKKTMAILALTTALFVSATTASAEGITGKVPTNKEINTYLTKHPLAQSEAQKYITKTSSKTVGRTDNTAALNSLNFVRLLTGLPQVKENKNFSNIAQSAAYLMNKNKMLAHQISVPAGMSSTSQTYRKGALGGLSSNIGAGYSNIQQSVLYGYMDDGGGNMASVGHRKWLLNPTLRSTGFGKVGAYTANYVFDNKASVNQQLSGLYTWSKADLNEAGGWGLAEKNYANAKIAWPSQSMPTQLMKTSTPFSLSLGKNFTITNNVKITMKNAKKTVTINSSKLKTGQHYSVSSSGYGYMNAIVWKPNASDFSYKSGETYKIKITGLKKNNKATTINYNVKFFNLATALPKPTLPKKITLKKGKSYTFSTLKRFDYTGSSNVSLKVSNAKTKRVNNYTFKAVSKGTSYVTVTNKAKNQTQKIKVTIK